MKNTKPKEDATGEIRPARRKSTRGNTFNNSDNVEPPPNKTSKIDELKQISDETKSELNQNDVVPIKLANNQKTEIFSDPKTENAERKVVSENLDRKVISREEEEANTRDSGTDLTEFQNTCSSIEAKITNINELKRKDKLQNADIITENQLDAILLTTNLKKLNRLTQIRGKMAKEKTQEVKKKVDGLHLDLQNLLYEVMHVKKEIQKCMNFSSKDEEIDLVSVDKFYEEAPGDISQPETTKNDAHKQMLARLDWELKRRKELSSEKESLLTGKKKTEAEINQKADYLCNLKPRLEQIIKASRPVQEYMNIPLEAEALLQEKAQFLPRPLYVLYIQAKAYKDVCDKNMDVLISGDLLEAKSLFNADDMEPAVSDASETENETEVDEQRSSRKHKQDKERLNEQKNQLLRTHPLSVCLEIYEKGVYKLKLKFSFMPALQINTVKIDVNLEKENEALVKSPLLSANNILQDLLSSDTGKESPNTANNYQLERLQLESFSSYVDTIGFPYFWVQWICGMNYMPNEDISTSVPDAALSVKHFQTVVQKMKSRMRSRLALQKQVQSLEQLIIPEPKRPSMKECFPTNIVSMLSSWRMFTYEEFLMLDCSKELEEIGVVSEDSTFHLASFTGEQVLSVIIVLHSDYPKKTPLMLLSLKDGNITVNTKADLKCVESEVNGYVEELLTKDDENMVLSNMLRRLQVCFDMYCETDTRNKTKERLYARKIRGRHRNRPYRYHEEGYFIHR